MNMRTPSCTKLIGETLGEFLGIDNTNPLYLEESLCIRVCIDIQKPLRRGMRLELRDGSRKWVSLQYERLSLFCYYYEIMGHTEVSCAKRIANNAYSSSFPYGPWLRAKSKLRRPGNERFFERFTYDIHDNSNFNGHSRNLARPHTNWEKVIHWLNLQEGDNYNSTPSTGYSTIVPIQTTHMMRSQGKIDNKHPVEKDQEGLPQAPRQINMDRLDSGMVSTRHKTGGVSTKKKKLEELTLGVLERATFLRAAKLLRLRQKVLLWLSHPRSGLGTLTTLWMTKTW